MGIDVRADELVASVAAIPAQSAGDASGSGAADAVDEDVQRR